VAKPEDMPLYLLRCEKCRKAIKYFGEYPTKGKCGYPPCDGDLRLTAIFDPIKQRKHNGMEL
jgi:predicted nucleic acid-binding Zn ribbon protein